MIERIEGRAQTGPDRRGAGGGELLATNDMRQACESRLPPPQRRHAGDRKYRLKPRVLFQKRVDRGFEIGLAGETGGRFLLRIEDIDPTRCRSEFEDAIDNDLAWLGLCWETPVRRQSEHFTEYRAALEKLTALGLIYPAFESRAEIARLIAEQEKRAPWPRDPDGAPLYPGKARA